MRACVECPEYFSGSRARAATILGDYFYAVSLINVALPSTIHSFDAKSDTPKCAGPRRLHPQLHSVHAGVPPVDVFCGSAGRFLTYRRAFETV
jgi:hypothetical protein